MQKLSKKVFWFILALFISNILARSDPRSLLSEPEKSLPNDSGAIELGINPRDNSVVHIGNNGVFSLITNYTDTEPYKFDISDIEESTLYDASFEITEKEYVYSDIAKCRLWKPLNGRIYTICNLEKGLIDGTYFFNFEGNFTYKGLSVNIFSNGRLEIRKLNGPVPLLYSSQQTIVIEERKEDYELKFKIEEYNDELLLLTSQVVPEILALDECSREGKELKCIIRKKIIEKFLANNTQTFSLEYKSNNENILCLGFNVFQSVLEIIIIDNTVKKKDINVNVTKILEKNIYGGSMIAFETNVKDIDDFTSSFFDLIYNSKKELNCFLKKVAENPLLILCSSSYSSGYISINGLDEKILNDTSIKYNFFISQGFDNEYVLIEGKGVIAYFAYPKVLDYTLKATYTVDYLMEGSLENIKDIRLNSNAKNLSCSNIGNKIKRCIVPKSHFENEESGYFFTCYQNYDGTSSKFYELSPIQVILPENMDIGIKIIQGRNLQVIGEKRTIIFSTNYNDNEKKKFSDLDIDNYISFRSTVEINNGYRI